MNLIYLLMISNIIITIIVCSYALYLHKKLSNIESNNIDRLINLKREILSINSASVGLGQNLIQVEKKIKLVEEKQQQLELHQMDPFPYAQATDLIEQGEKADALIDRFGYSEAEAGLLSLLQTVKNPKEKLS